MVERVPNFHHKEYSLNMKSVKLKSRKKIYLFIRKKNDIWIARLEHENSIIQQGTPGKHLL